MYKRERGNRRIARRDLDALDSRQHQHRADDVDQLRGQKQCAERYLRRELLRGETDGKMTDEH